MKRAKLVTAVLEGDTLRLMPERNAGRRGGYEEVPSKTISLPASTAAEVVGAQLNKAMSLCE